MVSIAESKDLADESIILALGEQKELSLPAGAKFSLGNSDILSYKFLPKKNSLLLKGKKLGFSDLVLWKEGKILQKYHLYILSKVNHLRSLYLANILKGMGLAVEMEGPIIFAHGTVTTLAQFSFIKRLEKKFPDHLFFQCEPMAQLRDELIRQVLMSLQKEGVQDLDCSFQLLNLICYFDQSLPPLEKLLQYLSSRFSVEFFPRPNTKWRQNYRVRMKLVQMERLDGQELQLGLQKLSGSYQELFFDGIKSIVLRNQFLLNQSKVQLSVLAEPETLLRPEVPALLEMGSQIPFKFNDGKGVALNEAGSVHHEGVHWAFAGLRIRLVLAQKGRLLQLAYETEFTRPDSGQNITGNKEASSLILVPGKAYQLFEIGYKTQGSELQALPWLSSIPFLGSLFRSETDQSTFKKIYGILTLEEFNE